MVFFSKKGILAGRTSWNSMAPTVTINSTEVSPTIANPIPITFALSNSSVDFTINSLTVSGGTAGNFSGSGTAYSCNITPDGTGPVLINIVANSFHDSVGRGNIASGEFGMGIIRSFTLQPDSSNDIDTFIYMNVPTTNYSTQGGQWIGYLNGTGIRRYLIKFDFSSIPDSAQNISATFTLYMEGESSSNSTHIGIYKLLRNWSLTESSWNYYSSGNAWQNQGGFEALDCEQTEYTGKDFAAVEAGGAKNIILTATTKADLGSNGWLLKTTNESVQDAYLFTSCNGATAANRPKITGTYQLNPAVPGGAEPGDYQYVVDGVNGNDETNGLYPNAWKTLTKAATTLTAGSVVYVRGGTYIEQITLDNDGTEANPIIFTNYPNETVIMNGDLTLGNGVRINGDWIQINNIEIKNFTGAGATAYGEHVTFDNIFVHHCGGAGIYLHGNYGTAKDCRSWYNSTVNENGASPTSWGSGLSVCRFPTGCTVQRCTVWNNWGEGISNFEAENTVFEDCVSYNNQIQYYISDSKGVIVRRNVAYCTSGNPISNYYTQWGFLVNDEKGFPVPLEINGVREWSSNNTIINNLAFDNNKNFGLAPQPSKNLTISNNTFINAESSCVFFYAGTLYENARFINNIIYQEGSYATTNNKPTNLNVSNNLWSKTPEGLGMLSGSDIVADPLFIGGTDTDPNSYKLQPSSPAKSAGVVEVATDFGGIIRSSPPTIGAWE